MVNRINDQKHRAKVGQFANPLLRPEQLSSLSRWGRYSKTVEYKGWLNAQHRNVARYRWLASRIRSKEDVQELFELVWEGQGGRRALNRSLYEKNRFQAFITRFRSLIDDRQPLPQRIEQFLRLKEVAMWGASLLLCYSNPYKYPFIGGFMTELIGLDKSQRWRSKQEARNEYSKTTENDVSTETWKYLGYNLIFQEVRAAMGVRSFLGVQNVFWNARMKGEEKIRFRPHQGITPEEALRRGRFGEDLVFRWEKQQGRNPRNRADENLGYDIESVSKSGRTRFIEVKSYGGMPVELTENEERVAEELGTDYFLYIVHRRPNGRYAVAKISDPARSCKLLANPTVRYQVQNWKKQSIFSFL